ncbi:hypothetical protein C1I95_21810 [Micromonospora craterilacus]|uniref:Uncharacterized protein n=1 Tax=Micromonospora craterilacus TaxID=1655439 RepID=A0A2W2ELH6_9ACTN|nr:hypothetical protein [Micromonospora craterilacus]PZG14430.1 hypothetical protein C1I95_21810 [Micromonospora craterilacus]
MIDVDVRVTPDEPAEDVAEPQRPPTRAERVAAAAGDAWRGLVDVFGVFDWITTVGVVMLLAGMWVCFGVGPALAGVGALVVWMGIAGGRAAARAAAGDVDEDQAVEPPRGRVAGEAV